MIRQRILLAVVAVVGAGTLAACGSLGETTASTSAPTTAVSTSIAKRPAVAAALHKNQHKKHRKHKKRRHHAQPAPSTPTPAPTPTHHHRRHVSAPIVQQGCTPLTNGGNCYEPGEFCRNDDHGASGVAGNGERIRCEDNNGWRWEPI